MQLAMASAHAVTKNNKKKSRKNYKISKKIAPLEADGINLVP
jgi:hypothetical protein